MAAAKRFCSILRIQDNVVIGIRGDIADVPSIVVPEGVVGIEMQFGQHDIEEEDNQTLTSITLPDTLTDIGDRVFANLQGLSSLVIPDAVTSIGSNAFNNCAELTSITLPAHLTHLGWAAFTHSGITSVALPNGLQYLSEELFNQCQELTSITLPSSLTEIHKGAFYLCTSLTSLTLPNTVTHIANRAFHNCGDLTHINFPDSLTTIGKAVFYGCVGLTSLRLPHALSVGRRAFKGCRGLTSVVFRPSVPGISCAFIAWSVGNMRNRDNWQLTTVQYLRNVVRLITVLTFERRDMSSMDPEGRPAKDRVFKGCTGLGFDKFPEADSDW